MLDMAMRNGNPAMDRPETKGPSPEGAGKPHWIARAARSYSLILVLFSVQLSGILCFDYYWRVERPSMDRRIALHRDVLDSSAPYEYRYRILIPKAADLVARALQHFWVSSAQPKIVELSYGRDAFAWAYICLDFLAFFFMLWAGGRLTQELFQYPLALFGMAVSCLLIDFTFRDHYFHPWSYWEGAFFALGLLLLYRERYWSFSVVSILGIFNRDTSVFLPLAFLFYAFPQPVIKSSLAGLAQRRAFRFAIGNLIVWLLGFLLLRQVIGYRPPIFSVETAWKGNTDSWPYALSLNLLLFGPMWLWLIRGIRMAPVLIRRAAIVIPLYLALLLVIGYWWEIRYWISILPILIPALIAGICQPYVPAASLASKRDTGYEP
jgi:hypothetical protein